jgi:hypothetical protein
MHPTNCLNCETILTADDNFCPTCGQKTDTHRLSLKHIFHEFVHTFTHADRGIFGLMADLTVAPGIVAREYVAGKRKKYYNPFTFFVLCAGIIVLANNFFGTYGEEPKPDPRVLSQLNAQQRKAYVGFMNRVSQFQEFNKHHSNIVAMIGLPFYALISWLFFRKRGYNYAEMLVANMLFLAFGTVLFSLFFSTWVGRFAGQPLYFYGLLAGMLLLITYIAWGLYQFLGFQKKSSMLLTWGVVLLINILWIAIVALAMFYYVFRSQTGTVLRAMWDKYF